MSLKINTNIPAMTALRNLGASTNQVTSAINKLSTGLRINSAADDPAGLIISEGMRGQLKGLEQALRNSQDAVNMAKTAEGALDEVSRLLRDIRGLAVHSANSAVVDAAQLQANQNSIRSTIDSIRRIADTTSWGTRKLLNGASGTQTNITATSLVSGLYMGSQFNGETVRSGLITMTRTTAATQATASLTTAFATTATNVSAGSFVINGVPFTTTASDTVQSVLDRINQQSANTGVIATTYANGGNVSIRLTSTKYGSNFPVRYTETSTVLNAGVATTASGVDAVFTVTASIDPTGTTTETFTGGQGPGVDGLTLSSPGGNTMRVTAAGNATSAATSIADLMIGSVRFQIGPNQDQGVTFALPDMDPGNLGTGAVTGVDLSTIDVTSQSGAEAAMSVIDAAIAQVAQRRGELGSFQRNFLESTSRSLEIAKENLTSSESAIRDANMAEEISNLTRLQILQQSGMSVLAQANQQPNQILQLLRQ